MATTIQEGMEAFKLFEDCYNLKIEFPTKAYLCRKNEIQSKVASHFLDLDLTFMNEELEAKEDKSTPQVETPADSPTPTT